MFSILFYDIHSELLENDEPYGSILSGNSLSVNCNPPIYYPDIRYNTGTYDKRHTGTPVQRTGGENDEPIILDDELMVHALLTWFMHYSLWICIRRLDIV